MAEATRSRMALILMLAFGTTAVAQEGSDRDPAGSRDPAFPAPLPAPAAPDPSARDSDTPFLDWLLGPFSQEDDPDGPINTDRPTFTPANTVVPRNRLQTESGYTYTHDLTRTSRIDQHGLPELSVRAGLSDRLEFRTFWSEGQMYSTTYGRLGAPTRVVNGLSDMEVGFKTQLIQADKDRKWLPTTALITSVIAPVGGDSPYSSQTVNPYVNLLYGWSVTDRLSVGGSTGYLAQRTRNPGGSADSFERYNQSLLAFYSATDRVTLFHEWYVLTYTNAADNRPMHFMDSGLLYRPTPNTQFDLRAGFGLGDRPSDFFTGAGFSIRF